MARKNPVKNIASSLEDSVTPHEATRLDFVPANPVFDDGVRALAKACNGFFYLGSDIEAQLRAIRFLRTRPDIAAALGIGVTPGVEPVVALDAHEVQVASAH